MDGKCLPRYGPEKRGWKGELQMVFIRFCCLNDDLSEPRGIKRFHKVIFSPCILSSMDPSQTCSKCLNILLQIIVWMQWMQRCSKTTTVLYPSFICANSECECYHKISTDWELKAGLDGSSDVNQILQHHKHTVRHGGGSSMLWGCYLWTCRGTWQLEVKVEKKECNKIYRSPGENLGRVSHD